MYEVYRNKREILLWCQAVTDKNKGESTINRKKRSRSPSHHDTKSAPSTKREACKQKIDEVEGIVLKLKEKHDTKFSVEQFSAWAHMIQLGKHSSYEAPPDLPYFGKHRHESISDVQPGSSSSSTQQSPSQGSDLSPSKRIHLRTECISQLDRWHALLEKGGIDLDQYETLKKTIFSDMFGDSQK